MKILTQREEMKKELKGLFKIFGRRKQAALRALDLDTCSIAAVEEAGEMCPGFFAMKCDECKNDVERVIQFGKPADDEDPYRRYWDVCLLCAEQACKSLSSAEW